MLRPPLRSTLFPYTTLFRSFLQSLLPAEVRVSSGHSTTAEFLETPHRKRRGVFLLPSLCSIHKKEIEMIIQLIPVAPIASILALIADAVRTGTQAVSGSFRATPPPQTMRAQPDF